MSDGFVVTDNAVLFLPPRPATTPPLPALRATNVFGIDFYAGSFFFVYKTLFPIIWNNNHSVSTKLACEFGLEMKGIQIQYGAHLMTIW